MTALILAGAAARLAVRSGRPDNDDAAFFIRAVERFSVAESRPHWPGYPAYVAAGKLAAALSGDAIAGLQALSALAVAAAAWPLAAIVRAWAASLGASPGRAAGGGVAAAALWLVLPISWVTGTQIVSDALGLACGLALLAACVRGERTAARGPWVAAAALAGVLPGVRLVNVSMVLPVAAKAWWARGERWWGGLRAPVLLVAAVVAGALPWVAWLALSDPRGYVRAGATHLVNHFTRHGESVLTSHDPAHRPLAALATLAVYGLGAGPPALGWERALAGVAWTLLAIAALRARPWRGGVGRIVVLWAGPHLLHVFLAHDAGYPRYFMAASAVATMGAGIAVACAGRGALAALLVALACVAPGSARVARAQAREPPVEYEAVRYLSGRARPALVVTSRTELLRIYAPDSGGRVVVAMMPAAEIPAHRGRWNADDRDLFSTAVPPQEASLWVPVAHFCQDPMIEPLAAHEMWLFRPRTPGEVENAVPECGESR